MQIFRHDLERTEGDRMVNQEMDRFLRQRLGKGVLLSSSWKRKEKVRNGLISHNLLAPINT
jgi:hypothetical protein